MVEYLRQPNSGRDETTTKPGRLHIVRAFPAVEQSQFQGGRTAICETVSRLWGCTLGGAEGKRLPFNGSGDEATSRPPRVALRGWAPVTEAGCAPMHSDKGRSPGPREVLMVETHPA